MTWARVDDRMHDDPRTEAAGIEAMGLWVVALSYMADHARDGVITRERVYKLAGRKGHWLAQRLVEAGWWEERTDRSFRLLDAEQYLFRVKSTTSAAQPPRKPADQPPPVNVEVKPDAGGVVIEPPGEPPDQPRSEPPDQPPPVISDDGPRESRGETPHAGARPVPVPVPVPVPDQRSQSYAPTAHAVAVPAGGMNKGQITIPFEPSAEPEEPAEDEKPQKAKKPDVPIDDLTPAERRVHAAIIGDVSLCPIVADPARTARDLLEKGPALDVVYEVKCAGIWLRDNPRKAKKNGRAFLSGWIGRAQERGGRPTVQAARPNPNAYDPEKFRPPPEAWGPPSGAPVPPSVLEAARVLAERRAAGEKLPTAREALDAVAEKMGRRRTA